MILALVALSPALAQDLALPIASPKASVSQQVGTVTVTVDYGSPAARERTVWGELVPYGKLWRTGANDATTLTVDGDITLGGLEVPAGSYALLTTPGESSWTVLLSTDTATMPWAHDAANDLGSFEVAPVEGPDRERLTFLFEDTTDRDATLRLEWAGVALPMAVAVDTPARATSSIDSYVRRSATRLAQAARFEMEEGNLDQALQLAEKAVSLGQGWYAHWALAQVQHAREEHKAAYKTAQKTLELGNADDGNFFYKGQVEEALASWPKK